MKKLVNRLRSKADDGKVNVLLWDPAGKGSIKRLKPEDGAVHWDNGHEHGCRGPLDETKRTLIDGEPYFVFNKKTGSPLFPNGNGLSELDGVSWAILHESMAFGQMGELDKDYRATIMAALKWIGGSVMVVGGGFMLYLIVSTLAGGGGA